MKRSALVLLVVSLFLGSYAQMNVTTNSDVNTLVNQFLGTGITLSGSPTKFCNGNGTGYFTNGLSTSCPLDSGIILSTGYASFLNRPYDFTASAGLNYGMNDPDLLSLNPQSNTDICYIRFNFIPSEDSLVFEYVFGSEEYLEWVGSIFNDVFGFFVTGPNPAGGNYNNVNLALVPSTLNIVSINTINNVSNSAYYINNYATGPVPGINDPNFTLDGFTVKMNIGLSVVPGSTYTIKMVIGDVSDPMWDSYVLLRSYSFSSISSSSLPIELVYFKALQEDDHSVKLEWQTASEVNNDFFTVERSMNGADWEPVKRVNGAGNSNITLSYSIVDEAPYSGTSYYRLKQTDFNGAFEYSRIESVSLNDLNSNSVKVYPNVTCDRVTVAGNETELSDIRLLNGFGQDVTNLANIHHLDESTLSIDLARLTNGVYLVKTKTAAHIVYKQ
jgi:hypothetical protein